MILYQQRIIDALHFRASMDAGTHPACIVAVGTLDGNGVTLDWAAYAGGYPSDYDRRAGAEAVRTGGDKLSKRTATALFPHLPAGYYRE